MPLALIGLLALGLGGAWWLSGTEGASAGSPRLAVDRTEIDLGRLPFEAPARAVFVLRNEGSGPLHIVEVSQVRAVKGCWPPQAVVGQTTIGPGKSTTLTMSFTMHAGMGGPHEFLVVVRTSDPAAPEQRLTVRSDWGPR